MTGSIDESTLNELLGKMVGDLGATVAAGSVVLGDRLGLYRALAEEAATVAQLAEKTGTVPRYIAEWLRGQAAGGYVSYEAATETFFLTPEQAFTLADPDGPVYLPGAFQLALGALQAEPAMAENFRTGAGLGWHQQTDNVHVGCEKFFRPGYAANIVTSWIPALDDVEAKLHAGAKVADVGCGLGASTRLMAQAYPQSSFHASDYHDGSIALARKSASDAALNGRISYEVAGAQNFTGSGFDLVATFDCLHDMGDPLGAAKHIRETLAPDGTWMIVEPFAGDSVAENLNPIGRVYYSFSTLLCLPNALSQPGGYSLGAQAGEAAIRQVVTDAGFTRFRRVAETPFNLIFQARL